MTHQNTWLDCFMPLSHTPHCFEGVRITTPLPSRVPLNGMFHQDSAMQWNKLQI